jgi:hypothetical protein
MGNSDADYTMENTPAIGGSCYDGILGRGRKLGDFDSSPVAYTDEALVGWQQEVETVAPVIQEAH